MGACGSAVSYLRQALAVTEGLADADEEVSYCRNLSQSNQFHHSSIGTIQCFSQP